MGPCNNKFTKRLYAYKAKLDLPHDFGHRHNEDMTQHGKEERMMHSRAWGNSKVTLYQHGSDYKYAVVKSVNHHHVALLPLFYFAFMVVW